MGNGRERARGWKPTTDGGKIFQMWQRRGPFSELGWDVAQLLCNSVVSVHQVVKQCVEIWPNRRVLGTVGP